MTLQTIQLALSTLIVIAVAFSVYYSFRYRRQSDPRLRGLLSSRMNIAMGVMLILIALTQLFFFTDSVTRRIFGTVCMLLGIWNLFAGLRNHMHYSRKA
ncbi:YtpI family protein [Paenibacillus puerhi]|uniref:YtpI family protein n=1 Tax=Paenibacillus puerhi TaxID=2692622 RepID=UPI00135B3D9A|nr:YtpI family protein [Paenibacillus puerhi]